MQIRFFNHKHHNQVSPVVPGTEGHNDMGMPPAPVHPLEQRIPEPPHIHHEPGHPMLPHERNTAFQITFSEKDWEVLCAVFGDEDTAMAAAESLREGPPEIRILAMQLMNLIEEDV